MQLLIGLVSLTLYGTSLVMLARSAKAQGSLTLSKKTTSTFLAVFNLTVIAHALSVNVTLFPDRQLLLDFYKVPSLIFCVISALTLLAFFRRMQITSLAILMIPFAMISILSSLFGKSPIAKSIADPGLTSHITLSILAYSLFTLAAAQALLLAIQEFELKHHKNYKLFRYLPPLQTMDKMLVEMLIAGFIMLSLSIATGFIFLDDMFAQHLIHKTVFSLVAWCIFALFLIGHYCYGWRGTTAAKMTLLGFLSLMFAYFGSKFVLEIILARQ